MAIIRRPRFQRSPTALPFQITERDVEIVRRVFEHRFLNSMQICQLVPGSRQQILRRLQALFHGGYLDRPRCQIEHFHQLGTRPMVYGLGKAGASMLGNEVASHVQHSRWTARNAAAKRFFLDHTLQVADVMIAFERACERQENIHFVRHPLSQTPDPSPRWTVSFAGQEITVIPDAVFAIDVHKHGHQHQRIHYFLEADRGTMPVVRKKLNQTSLFRKLLAYEATWSQGVHRTALKIDRFRVLTVTPTDTRVEHLRSACARLQRGHGLFLFTDVRTLRSAPDLFALEWCAAKTSAPTRTLLG